MKATQESGQTLEQEEAAAPAFLDQAVGVAAMVLLTQVVLAWRRSAGELVSSEQQSKPEGD